MASSRGGGTLGRMARVALAPLLCAAIGAAQESRTSLAPEAAVVLHLAPALIGNPPQPVYLAYDGTEPPPDLWRQVSHLNGLEPISRRGSLTGDGRLPQVLDVGKARHTAGAVAQVTATVVGPVGIADQSCTYTARLKRGTWRVDPSATRCLVL